MTPLPRLEPSFPLLAFDVGGTDVKATVVAEDGTIAAPVRFPTPAPGPRIVDELLDALTDAAHRLLPAGPAPKAIGLALPGIVDDDAGLAVFSENLRWRDVDFRARIAERTDVPVAIIHDVRACALAESRLGAAAGLRDAVVVPVGTGIAAGIIAGGSLLVRGGYAGEIGHAIVRPGGQPCVCGHQGCLEATSSAAAIARRYSQATGQPVAGARDVLAATATDPVAAAIWDDAIDALAFGLSHVCAALAPEAIIIGGGLSHAGDALFTPLQERLDAYTCEQRVPVRPARLGGDAGVVGAALRAHDAAGGASA